MDSLYIKLFRENRTSISQFVLTNKIYIFVYSDNSPSQTRFAYRPAHIPSMFIERKWRLIPFSGLGHGLSVRFSQGNNDLIVNILVTDNLLQLFTLLLRIQKSFLPFTLTVVVTY